MNKIEEGRGATPRNSSETWRHDADQYVFLPGEALPLNLNTEEGAAAVVAMHAELRALRSEIGQKLCPDCGCELECVKHGCAKKYAEHRNSVLEEAAKVCEEEVAADFWIEGAPWKPALLRAAVQIRMLKNAAPQSSPDNGHCSKGTENKAAESASHPLVDGDLATQRKIADEARCVVGEPQFMESVGKALRHFGFPDMDVAQIRAWITKDLRGFERDGE